MSARKALCDFLSAFVIFIIFLTAIALITAEGFLEGAVFWDKDNFTLTLFGSNFVFDKTLPEILKTLFDFNNSFFGNGFCEFIRNAASFVLSVLTDAFKLSYGFIKNIVGGI